MNKDKFLKMLNRKLSVLDEVEIKDILNEYESYIKEKVISGKTEEEAVLDFGDINELSKEILSAYEINTKKKRFGETIDNVIEETSSHIDKDKLKMFAEDMKDSFSKNFCTKKNGIDYSKVFKIVLIVLIVSVIFNSFFLIALPFRIVGFLLSLIWNILMFLIVMYIVYKIFIEDETCEDNIVENVESSSRKSNSYKYKSKKSEKKNYSIFIIVVIMILLFSIVIPIIATLVPVVILFGASIVVAINNPIFLGITLALGGVIIINLTIIGLFKRILNRDRRIFEHLLTGLFFGFFIIGTGATQTIFMADKFEYETDLENFTLITNFEDIKSNDIFKFDCTFCKIEKEIDNSITEGYRLEISYYEELGDIYVKQDANKKMIYIYQNHNIDEFEVLRKLIKEQTSQLKNSKLVNYNKVFKLKVKIIANDEIIKKIEY